MPPHGDGIYGHVICADDRLLATTGLDIQIDGKRLKGQPKQRRLFTPNVDLRGSQIYPDRERRITSRRTGQATEQEKCKKK